MTEMICRLCGVQSAVVQSHVIPAFVGRWIKGTSATGYLRTFHQPNRRVQDLRALKLLCPDCEQRFSVAEGLFARCIFLPFHEGRCRFSYEDWLLYFAVSLAWRCSVSSDQAQLERYPQHIGPVEAARSVWADFLLGRSTRISPYRFNMFFTPAGLKSSHKVPEGVAFYLLRVPDATPVYAPDRTAVYVKLPGIFFWTQIVPPDPGGWRGTKINKSGNFKARNQCIEDRSVGNFLNDRIETVSSRMRTLSDKQRQRIEESVRKNPQRAANSRTVAALLEDARLLQENFGKPD